MNAVVIGGSPLRECPRCEGIWADADVLHRICEDQDKQSAVLGMAGPVVKPESQDVEPASAIHYIPCPVCGDLMNRVNFAHCSHVIVNVCGRHGTWFDRDELRRIVEFIRSGGLMEERAQEVADLQRQQRELEGHAVAACGMGSTFAPSVRYDFWKIGIAAAAVFLRILLTR
jgi:Zn-finger nucleic acid-binding protein